MKGKNSSKAGWEFTEVELKTYSEWAREGIRVLLDEFGRRVHTKKAKEVEKALKEVLKL